MRIGFWIVPNMSGGSGPGPSTASAIASDVWKEHLLFLQQVLLQFVRDSW